MTFLTYEVVFLNVLMSLRSEAVTKSIHTDRSSIVCRSCLSPSMCQISALLKSIQIFNLRGDRFSYQRVVDALLSEVLELGLVSQDYIF